MLGLGESEDELKEAMADLRAIDVDILTLPYMHLVIHLILSRMAYSIARATPGLTHPAQTDPLKAYNVAIALASDEGLSAESKHSTTSAIAAGIMTGTLEDTTFRSDSKKPSIKSVDTLGLGRALAKKAKKIASLYSDVISAKILDVERCKELEGTLGVGMIVIIRMAYSIARATPGLTHPAQTDPLKLNIELIKPEGCRVSRNSSCSLLWTRLSEELIKEGNKFCYFKNTGLQRQQVLYMQIRDTSLILYLLTQVIGSLCTGSSKIKSSIKRGNGHRWSFESLGRRRSTSSSSCSSISSVSCSYGRVCRLFYEDEVKNLPLPCDGSTYLIPEPRRSS
ncbi:hypothetical protein ACET3Z_031242 [Daucus carota]